MRDDINGPDGDDRPEEGDAWNALPQTGRPAGVPTPFSKPPAAFRRPTPAGGQPLLGAPTGEGPPLAGSNANPPERHAAGGREPTPARVANASPGYHPPGAEGARGGPPGTGPERPHVDIVGMDATAGLQAPQARPNVDNVGNGGVRVRPFGALGRTRPAEAPSRTQSDDTDPQVLLTPMPRPRAAAAPRGPSGPSVAALETVRRAAKARLAGRAAWMGVDPKAGSQPSSRTPGVTVTQATLDGYLRRGQKLFDRYRRELNIQAGAEDVSPVEFVNWLLARKPTLKSSTWRLYRQHAFHFLDGFPSHETERATAMLENDIVDRQREPVRPEPGRGKPPRRTSALKEKRLPAEDLDRITTYLQSFSRSQLAGPLADWLRAGILCGLRPGEWRATDLEVREEASAPHDRRAYLYVLNAKSTNGRTTGAVRTLDISAFSEPDLACVQRLVTRSREWLQAEKFGDMLAACNALLYASIDKIWPKRRRHYSLYSARHQAIANWKQILQPVEIAAIVGHGVTNTAAENYGKRRSGWGPGQIPPAPRAVAEELALVKDRVQLYQRRYRLEIRAGLRKPGDIPEFPLG